jgi:hypothetical protein
MPPLSAVVLAALVALAGDLAFLPVDLALGGVGGTETRGEVARDAVGLVLDGASGAERDDGRHRIPEPPSVSTA